MKENILIVEDEFIVANDLRLMLVKAGYTVCGIAASVDEAKRIIEKSKPTWVLLDIFLQDGSMGIDLAAHLTEKNIGFIYISANTNQTVLEAAKATQPYGFLVKPFREKDLLIMLDITREKHQQNLQFAAQREVALQKQLGYLAGSTLEAALKLAQIPGAFQSIIPFDLLRLIQPAKRESGVLETTFLRTGFDEYQCFKNQEVFNVMGISNGETSRIRFKLPETLVKGVYNGTDFRRTLMDEPWEKQLSSHFRMESKLSLPVNNSTGEPALLVFYSRKPDTYTNAHLSLLSKAESALNGLLTSLSAITTFRETEAVNRPVASGQPKAAVSPLNRKFEGIIGNSPALLRVLDNINIVAPSPISVLILGESGTGKERVAQCIHNLSPRKAKPIITVNCAALPSELIESELFGHEKGAFTGASEKRTGKFELADGGTIFLDEIGEMPLDAQVKLLRVLQEKEIEHVGGSKTFKVDVRIIAATNRKLEKEVAEGRFRLDLYYRLNVFPIELPSLMERKDDIPLLANYFVGKYNRELGKSVKEISAEAMSSLMSYHWPGNIRELEHTLERSLLLTSGQVLTKVSLPGATTEPILAEKPVFQMKTLEQMEAEHILGVLKNCNGKVCGMGGAAEVLGLPPSTLNSKIKKLGIRRESYFNQ